MGACHEARAASLAGGVVSLTREAFERTREAIVSGALEFGEPLSETQIATPAKEYRIAADWIVSYSASRSWLTALSHAGDIIEKEDGPRCRTRRL
jgi:hypothetical protein